MPLAIAAEDDPDCESDQPWIGYNPNTAAAKAAYQAAGAPGGLNPCEGEHWDGQDTVDSTEGSCSVATSVDPVHVNRCMGSDPNTMPGAEPTNPLGLRVSQSGSSAADLQLYSAANIASVGRAAVYVDGSSAAVYLRDNTITDDGENLLAQAISAARLTRGFPAEGDCNQETYTRSANGEVDGEGRPVCHRDNTAVTVEHALLA